MTIRRTSVRKAYREAILQVFGCGVSADDLHLLRACKESIFLGGKDPCGWSSDDAVLCIYTENGIPTNGDPDCRTLYMDMWFEVDRIAFEKLGIHYYTEMQNPAVVCVWEI
jgi:hypothetical protein